MPTIHTTTLDFLQKISANNNRSWFDKHKVMYQAAKENIELFAQDLAERIAVDSEMKNMTPEYKLFRIYRDVRFSKNKMPFKTNFGIVLGSNFKEEKASFYLNIEIGKSFLGGGIYHPSPQKLQMIRAQIAKDKIPFEEIVQDKTFSKYYTLEGDQVKSSPKGYSKDHPAIQWLRYKDFVAVHQLSQEDILSKQFSKKCYNTFKKLYPFIHFLNNV